MNKRKRQMSEAFINAVFLSLSGGFQDAYTYFCRRKVFANAQTGNVVFMSTYFFKGDWYNVLRYFVPVFVFICGIFIAEVMHRQLKNMKVIHWRQLVIVTEIIMLFAVGFIPHELDILANALVSCVCAMQFQTFRKIDGYVYASTMCMGNIRSATEAVCSYFYSKDKVMLYKSFKYFGIILFFAVGAGVGSIMTDAIGIRAIWLCCVLLAVSFILMRNSGED